jgi:glycosyltransferase involved in cell wall biosynthesis
MNLLVITYYWYPSGGPGVQRWLKFIKYLPEFGIKPFVLTVDPARAEYPVIDSSLEADIDPELEVFRTDCRSMYDLYKKFTGSKTAPYSGFANESKPSLLQKIARFIRGNFFLPDARRGWIKYAFAEACRIIEKYGIETVITTGPPHSTHLAGLKIKKKYGMKWIVDFRDPWTAIFYNDSLYQTRWAKRINRRLEHSVLAACDHLLLVVDYRDDLNIAPSKVSFIPNGFDTIDFDNKQPVNPDVFTVCYTGTVAESYPTDKLLEAFVALKPEMVFKLRFVGKITDSKKKAFVEQLGDSVEFNDFVPHRDVINIMLSSSALLMLIPKTDKNRFILPGKVFEYLATGKPVLVIGPDSAATQIVKQAGTGATFDYDDMEGIKKWLSQQYQKRLQGILPAPDWEVINQFSRKRLTQQLAEIIFTQKIIKPIKIK